MSKLVRISFQWDVDLMIRQYGDEGTENQNGPSPSPKERQDFDDSANDLWSLYGKEAKSHDEARIKTLKDDMDSVLIFVCASFLLFNQC